MEVITDEWPIITLKTLKKKIDSDEFDQFCDHLVVIDKSVASDFVVGTYRLLLKEKNERYKRFYSEKILYLSECFLPPFKTENIVKKVFSRNEMGLPSDGFVFTCFNRIEKITRREFIIWINLLKRVERSVLCIVKP